MKTIFEIAYLQLPCNFEEDYKNNGFVLNEQTMEYYKIFDREIYLNKGDRVNHVGFHRVAWKCFDIDKDIVTYVLILE